MAVKKEVFSVGLRTGEEPYKTGSLSQALIVGTLNCLQPGIFAAKGDLTKLIASRYQKPNASEPPERALQSMVTAVRKGFSRAVSLQIATGYPPPESAGIGIGYGLITANEISDLRMVRVDTGQARNNYAFNIGPERFAPRNEIEKIIQRLEDHYASKTNKNPLESLTIPLNNTEWLASVEQIKDRALADRLTRFINIYLEPPPNHISSGEQESIVYRTWPIKGQDVVTAVKLTMKPITINESRVKDIMVAGIIRDTDPEAKAITEYGIKELMALIAFFHTYEKKGGVSCD